MTPTTPPPARPPEAWMRLAAEVAERGQTMFGAVLVRGGALLAEAANTVAKDRDPSAHAELSLIRRACRELVTTDLDGCTLYTTVEPCPMCAAACVWSGVSGVVFGASIAEVAELGVPQIALSCEELFGRVQHAPTLRGGVERERCLELCQRFW
ncbi:nucleoside deaminase [Truepera radiovictrix]|uniref:CMP/dCMP deaminase zinc-binding protein n=1 Tax=Truepera radiovictrix (strain DSM 17093 / CIP 108686 / LMG 22925 / RQ-24) TaxID=649638 RepID=D7CRM2_TRURR|nr:nucleoside deaminase [Truepera radiovictrix]ADI13512.1 CMP/dCMP deaminase zinc-binding protein [Truepera radiovictrix DSM 17093]WMT57926.1 nucleoside deaminase [Truepera radiovictrix]